MDDSRTEFFNRLGEASDSLGKIQESLDRLESNLSPIRGDIGSYVEGFQTLLESEEARGLRAPEPSGDSLAEWAVATLATLASTESQEDLLAGLLENMPESVERRVLFVREGGQFVPWRCLGFDDPDWTPATLEASDPLVSAAARDEMLLYREEGLSEIVPWLPEGGSPAAACAAPLTFAGECLAVLYADSNVGFSPNTIYLLAHLGTLVLKNLALRQALTGAASIEPELAEVEIKEPVQDSDVAEDAAAATAAFAALAVAVNAEEGVPEETEVELAADEAVDKAADTETELTVEAEPEPPQAVPESPTPTEPVPVEETVMEAVEEEAPAEPLGAAVTKQADVADSQEVEPTGAVTEETIDEGEDLPELTEESLEVPEIEDPSPEPPVWNAPASLSATIDEETQTDTTTAADPEMPGAPETDGPEIPDPAPSAPPKPDFFIPEEPTPFSVVEEETPAPPESSLPPNPLDAMGASLDEAVDANAPELKETAPSIEDVRPGEDREEAEEESRETGSDSTIDESAPIEEETGGVDEWSVPSYEQPAAFETSEPDVPVPPEPPVIPEGPTPPSESLQSESTVVEAEGSEPAMPASLAGPVAEPEAEPDVEPAVPQEAAPVAEAPKAPDAAETFGLTSEEFERYNNEARRFARLLVSEIKLYNEESVDAGRQSSSLYERLRRDIDRSREMYQRRAHESVRAQHDFFDEELVRILAQGESAQMGEEYPGPMVG